MCTLDSGIDVGQGINVGPRKFAPKSTFALSNKAVGPGKKLISVRPTSIRESRVISLEIDSEYVLKFKPSKNVIK